MVTLNKKKTNKYQKKQKPAFPELDYACFYYVTLNQRDDLSCLLSDCCPSIVQLACHLEFMMVNIKSVPNDTSISFFEDKSIQLLVSTDVTCQGNPPHRE